MRVPDYFEPLTGYRAWNVLDNGLLCGRHATEPWPVKQPMVARCAQGTRAHLSNKGVWKPPPTRGCSCGVHAYTTLEQAKSEQSHPWGLPVAGVVWGSVKLWGRVIEFERGYRAEFAYPVSIVTNDESAVKKLAVYGVPVTYEPPPPPPVDDSLPMHRSGWVSFISQGPAYINYTVPTWWRKLGTVSSVSWLDEPGDPLVWTPPDNEAITTLHVPDSRAREQRSIALWKEIANGPKVSR